MSKSAFVRACAAIAIVAVGLAGSVNANHAWGNYHWARTSNPVNLQIGSNLTTAAWRTALGSENVAIRAISDWNLSRRARSEAGGRPLEGQLQAHRGPHRSV